MPKVNSSPDASSRKERDGAGQIKGGFYAALVTKVAVVLLAVSMVMPSVPASAGPHWHGRRGFLDGPGLNFGLAGAAIAASVAADSYCVRYLPVYEDCGNYVGRRPVNAC